MPLRTDRPLVATGAGAFLLGILTTALLRGRRPIPAAVLAVVLMMILGTAAFAHGDDDHGASERGAALMEPALPATDLAQTLPDGSVFVPKPTQRPLVLRTSMTGMATVHRTVELLGRVTPDPNAGGVVRPTAGGRLSPPPSGLFPRLGTRVRSGDVLATVTPPV